MRTSSATTALIALLGLLVCLCAYVVSYGLIVEHGIAVGGLSYTRFMPDYGPLGDAGHWLFGPIHRVDRELRPDYWEPSAVVR